MAIGLQQISEFEKAGIFLAPARSVIDTDPTGLTGVRWQVWPDEITDEKSVEWGNIPIIGRSEPIKTYFASRQRVFAFSLFFVASADQSDGGTSESVRKKVNFLRALVYPRRTPGGLVLTPPPVLLIVGDLISSRCVASTVRASYSGPWDTFQRVRSSLGPLESVYDEPVGRPYFNLPIIAKVDIVLEEVNEHQLEWSDITDIQ